METAQENNMEDADLVPNIRRLGAIVHIDLSAPRKEFSPLVNIEVSEPKVRLCHSYELAEITLTDIGIVVRFDLPKGHDSLWFTQGRSSRGQAWWLLSKHLRYSSFVEVVQAIEERAGERGASRLQEQIQSVLGINRPLRR